MARPQRGPAARLAAEPERFDPLQAVRLLEHLRPELARLGHDAPARLEAARLGVARSLAPARGLGVAAFAPAAGGGALAVDFAGLTGPAGALPHHYTALVTARLRQKDSALADFLDLFHHRLLALLYRAWRRRSAALSAEGTAGPGDARRALLAIAGFSGPSAGAAMPASVPELAGLFARRTRTAAGLRAAVAVATGAPVAVTPLAGQWLYLGEGERCRLGTESPRRLGADAVLGRRVWDRQGRALVTVGPLDRAGFDALSRPGPARAELESVARTYAGADLDLDVALSLRAADVPGARLLHAEARRPRLGRDVWLASHRPAAHAADSALRVA